MSFLDVVLILIAVAALVVAIACLVALSAALDRESALNLEVGRLSRELEATEEANGDLAKERIRLLAPHIEQRIPTQRKGLN